MKDIQLTNDATDRLAVVLALYAIPCAAGYLYNPLLCWMLAGNAVVSLVIALFARSLGRVWRPSFYAGLLLGPLFAALVMVASKPAQPTE